MIAETSVEMRGCETITTINFPYNSSSIGINERANVILSSTSKRVTIISTIINFMTCENVPGIKWIYFLCKTRRTHFHSHIRCWCHYERRSQAKYFFTYTHSTYTRLNHFFWNVTPLYYRFWQWVSPREGLENPMRVLGWSPSKLKKKNGSQKANWKHVLKNLRRVLLAQEGVIRPLGHPLSEPMIP